jgi:hemerythrin
MLVHSKAISKLAPSDYAMIKNEHQQLEKYLVDFHDACACSLKPDSDEPICAKEQQTSCHGRMPSFLFHIIDLAGRHFDHEESIMLSRPNIGENNDYFRVHRQAHLDIMKTLQVLADNYFTVSDKTSAAEVYRLFYGKIAGIFNENDRQFDDPFIESTKQN